METKINQNSGVISSLITHVYDSFSAGRKG